jgi:predicted RNA-binding protein with PIN domain
MPQAQLSKTYRFQKYEDHCFDMKHYILDAYNIMHKRTEWMDLFTLSPDLAREAFIQAVSALTQKYPSFHISVVFDGPSMRVRYQPANVSIHFCQTRQIADEIVKEIIARDEHQRMCVVVSSDIEIVKYARVHGCTVLTANEFLHELDAMKLQSKPRTGSTYYDNHSEKPSHTSKREMEEFKRIFGK